MIWPQPAEGFMLQISSISSNIFKYPAANTWLEIQHQKNAMVVGEWMTMVTNETHILIKL